MILSSNYTGEMLGNNWWFGVGNAPHSLKHLNTFAQLSALFAMVSVV